MLLTPCLVMISSYSELGSVCLADSVNNKKSFVSGDMAKTDMAKTADRDYTDYT